MDVEAVTTFFALLAVLGIVFLVTTLVGFIIYKVSGSLPAPLQTARDAIAPVALQLAFVVAVVCTAGSLYLSEVANFPPCYLCWWQRFAMYPQVIILGLVAWIRALPPRVAKAIRWTSLVVATIGVCISTYHYLLERFPDNIASACTDDVPCSTVWIWKFHFLSIPGMAGIGFLLVITLNLLATPSLRVRAKEQEEVH